MRRKLIHLINFFIALLISLPLYSQNNPSEVLNLGWIYFNNGRYEEALSISDSVLKQDNLTEKEKTNIYYFQGFVYSKLRKFEEAQGCFKSAKQGFQKNGPATFATLSEIGLAKALIDEEKYELARAILKKIPGDALSGSSKGYEYFVWSRLLFYSGDYAQGVVYAKMSLDEYKKDGKESDIMNAISELGMHQLFLGFSNSENLDQKQRDDLIKKGLLNSRTAVASAMEQKDLNRTYYFMINLVLYEQCIGIRSSKKEFVEYYIKKTADPELRQLLDKVEKLATSLGK